MSTLFKLKSNLAKIGLELSDGELSKIHIMLLKLAECEHQYYLETKKDSNCGNVKTIKDISNNNQKLVA